MPTTTFGDVRAVIVSLCGFCQRRRNPEPPAAVVVICGDGRQVGSPTITRFIAQNQPLLGCSGHIHESPNQPGGKWAAHVGRTLWLQPGQEGEKLYHVSLEMAGDWEIRSTKHSVFGPLPT